MPKKSANYRAFERWGRGEGIEQLAGWRRFFGRIAQAVLPCIGMIVVDFHWRHDDSTLDYMVLLSKRKVAITLAVAASFVAAVAQTAPRTRGEGLLRDSVPATWNYESTYFASSAADDAWWKGFDDATLAALIARGTENSFDLSATRRRIEIARQTWELAKSAYYPTIGLSAGWSKNRTSADASAEPGRAMTSSYFSLGLNFSWEVDVFGRVRAQSKESAAAYRASQAEYAAATISLSANIATAYFNLRMVQGEMEIARRQLESQRKITALAQARFEAGLASKLDVAQAQTVLYTTEATVPQLANLEQSALNSLALLVGCYPEELQGSLSEYADLPNPFRVVNIGVPTDLLRRRPDIARAEAELAGYAAAVGVAKKDFLPTLALTGSIGTTAHRASDLFKSGSLTYSIAPQLSWTLFEGLARNHRVAAAKEQMLAGIDNYNLVVMQAVIEADDALSAYDCALRRIALVKRALDASQESFNLAVDRYKRGLTAFTDVMNALVNVLDSENSLLQTRGLALSSLVKVYAAVAGDPTAPVAERGDENQNTIAPGKTSIR